jgi:acyl dehydratase
MITGQDTPAADLFEGLPIGEKSRSAGRTITEGEFALLTDITWTIGELHSNAVYGRQHTSFGERALGGPIVSALVASLASNRSPLSRRLRHEYGLRIVAAVGISARYLAPVLPGDTLWADTWLESVRPSASRPGLGVAVMRDDGINQNEILVTQVTRRLLVERS